MKGCGVEFRILDLRSRLKTSKALGFQACDLRFRVSGLGSGFRVKGLGLRV